GGVRVMVMLKDFRLDLDAMARAITPMTKLVFIANPNNPSATIVTRDEVEHFMARVPERTIVVFDEAYIEFAMGPDFPDTLVDAGRSAADIYQKLLHHGVIVRPMTPFGLETALRITVGTPEENRKLVKALRVVLGKTSG